VALSPASAAAVGAFDAVLSPDPLSPVDAAAVSVAVLPAGAVAGGWKATQLADGRGRAVADLWTLAWLCVFAAWISMPWLQLAF